jgi:hypothetical protein
LRNGTKQNKTKRNEKKINDRKESAKRYIIKTADCMIELTTKSVGTLASASVLAAVAIHSIESDGKHFACHSGIPDESGTALFDCGLHHFVTLRKNWRDFSV